MASPDSVRMSAARLERIGPAMQSYVDRGTYAGVSTIIARRGIVVHAAQYGLRDKEAGKPMTEDTIFRLYSMTKPVVSTALMMLLEEGRFRLIEPVARYVPAFARVKVLEHDDSFSDPKRPMMVRDLLTHTSGLTYHFLSDSNVSDMYADAKNLEGKRFARRGGRRSRPISARFSAGVALAVQLGHRRRRSRHRSDFGTGARRFS
jgi:CubicO group peptidase (beta-lactamase class C family)